MSDLTSDFKKRILEEITERPEILERKEKTISSITEHLESLKLKYKMDYRIFLGGSHAKGTDIRGSDIDIFLLFPEEYDPKRVLGVLKKEFPSAREEYSEHPYLIISNDKFSTDIVPAYMATSTNKLLTSVDRTPFHVEFVKDNFTQEMKNEVRILKQFMKTIGVYGAESLIQGFSGYVAELIIYHFKTFENAIKEAAEWDIPLSLNDNSKKFPDANLIIIDPVDTERNAAANVSKENLSTFILAAKLFSFGAQEHFFSEARTDSSLPDNAVAIFVPCKRCNKQILGPNLRRISSVLRKELETIGFKIIYSSIFVDKGGYIILIPESERMGEASLHIGPPVTSANVKDFLEKWNRGTKFGPPFIVDKRIAVLRERKPREITEAIATVTPRLKFSEDFQSDKMLIITGKDILAIPDFIRKHFIDPSLGKWIQSSWNVK